MLINDNIPNINQCSNHHTIHTTFCGFLQTLLFVFSIYYLRKIHLIRTSIYDLYIYNDYLSKRSETYLYLSLTIFQFFRSSYLREKRRRGWCIGKCSRSWRKNYPWSSISKYIRKILKRPRFNLVLIIIKPEFSQLNLFFFFTATERISMGLGKHATQKRMVKTRFKDYALRGLVCVWHQMSQKWNKKFPVMSPSLSSQALAIRKK